MTDNELNALVAERVMELKNVRPYTGHEDLSREHICEDGIGTGLVYDRYYSDIGYEVCNVPDYANDIAAAFQVVGKMREHFTYLTLQVIRLKIGARFDGTQFAEPIETVWDDTASRAICLAALDAMGVKVDVFAVAVDATGDLYGGGG